MVKTSGVLWPRFNPQVAVQPVGDLGELAARLGGLSTYSRSGTVMFADGFEDGLSPYTVSTSPPNFECSLATDNSYRGANSCYFFHHKDSGTPPQLFKYIPLYRSGKMALEFHFRNEDDNLILNLGFSKREGGIIYGSGIKITVSDNTIKYMDSAGAYQTLDSIDLTVGSFKHWHAVKLFVDFDTNNYVKLWIDDNEYLLTDISFLESANAGSDYLSAVINTSRDAANDMSMYVDDFIVTVDET